MKRLTIIATLFLAALLPPAADAQVFTIVTDRDTWIDESGPLVPHGGDAELLVHNQASNSNRALFHFDVSAIAPGTEIAGAIFNLFVTAPDASGDSVEVYRVTDTWDEATANWSNTATDFDGATLHGSFKPNVLGAVSFDLAKLAQDWIDGTTPNHGVVFIATSTNITSKYASREWATAVARPTLTIITKDHIRSNYRMAADTYTGDGFGFGRPITVGFQPDFVIVNAEGGDHAMASSATMPPGTAKELSHGSSLWSDEIMSLDADGFTVGQWANQNGNTFHWIAFEAAPGVMTVDTYSGDGTAGHEITGVGFQPAYVMIMGDVNQPAQQRFADQPPDFSVPLGSGGEFINAITAFTSDGFILGSDNAVNRNGSAYHYVAWNAIPGLTSTGTYTGTGADSVVFSDPNFRPHNLFVRSAAGVVPQAQRTASITGDVTLAIGTTPAYSNGIQRFTGGGFEVGSDASVNEAGEDFYWVAFNDSLEKAVAGNADLMVGVIVDDPGPVWGQTVTFTVSVGNLGPDSVTAIVANDLLPPDLTYLGHDVGVGTYDGLSGDWNVGTLQNGTAVSLLIHAMVEAGTEGTTIDNIVTISSSDATDLNASNDADTASVDVAIGRAAMRFDNGRYVGDGAGLRAIGGLDFTPDFVMITNDAGVVGVCRSSTMPAGMSKALGTATAFTGSQIISLAANGFSVGNDVATNAPGTTYYWTAFRSAKAAMKVGTYVGIGNEELEVASIGFQPDYMIVMPETAREALQRFGDEGGDECQPFRASIPLQNRIVDFDHNQFVLGTNNTVNANTETYHYVAWGSSSQMDAGVYVGDGSGDRKIPSPHEPEYLILARDEPGTGPILRPASAGPDTSFVMPNATPITGAVKAFEADGFRVGSLNHVNATTEDYFYATFSDSGGAPSSGTFNVASGVYTGDGSGSKPINIGFQPDAVLIKGDGPTQAVIRTADMTGDSSKELASAAPLAATRITSLDAAGFTVGIDVRVNSPGTQYYWTAFQAEAGMLDVGSYTGDGVGRTIPVGFQPAYVIVLSEDNHLAHHRFAPQNPNFCYQLNANDAKAGRIVDFNPSGFEIGTHATVNQATATYHYLAFANTAGFITGSSFPGDGSDDKNITAPGFQPEFVLIQHPSSGSPAVIRPSSLPLDSTLPVDNSGGAYGNGIQALTPSGFQVGSDVSVNAAGQEMFYAAFGNGSVAASADVALSMDVDDPNPDQGQSITYTITFVNSGPDTATSVVVTDLLPGGTTYVSDVPSLGGFDDVTGVWNIGTIPNGGVETLAITAAVDSGTAGAVITNIANVTGMGETDPDSTNNTAIAVATVNAERFEVITGTYTGTGVGPLAITSVGVQPSAVFVRSSGTEPTIVRTSTMAASMSKKLGVNEAVLSNRIVSLDNDGFTVGDTPGVNAPGVQYHYTAFCAGDSVMTLGSYVGDNTDNRDLDLVGFQPDYLMVFPESAEHSMQRFATEAFDESLPLHNDGVKGDRIQGFRPLGFQVGNHNTVNNNGVRYHYLAFKETPGLIAQDAFVGTGAPQTIGGLGFTPESITIKSDQNEEGAHRNQDAGILTMPYRPGPTFIDGITAFGSDQFDVGADNRVNKSGDDFHWVAFQSSTFADLDIDVAVNDTFPAVGDTITFDVTLTNLGPIAATGVQATDLLPTGLTYVSDTPTQGSYFSPTGLWSVGVVAVGDTTRLAIDALVGAGTAGSTLDNIAGVTALAETDTVTVNDVDTVSVTIQSTAIALSDEPGSLYPAETFAGQPDLKIRIGLNNPAAKGVLLDTSSSVEFTDGSNTYTSTLANPTYVPAGAADFTISFASGSVSPAIVTGAAYPLTLSLSGTTDESVSYADTLYTNASNEILVQQPRVGVEARVLGNTTILPGARAVTLLALDFGNGYGSDRTLDSLTVTHTSTGAGDQAQIDSQLEAVHLLIDTDSSGTATPGDSVLATTVFAAGTAVFAPLGWVLPAYDVGRLLVSADVDSFLAHDADIIDAAIHWSSDIVFAEPTVTDDFTPLTALNSFGASTINGMASYQLSLSVSPPDTLYSGQTDRLVATILVPQNGYSADQLNALEVLDGSGGHDKNDFGAVRLYADDGDASFDPGSDTLLGAMVFSGDRYTLTGATLPINGSARLFVAADIAANPTSGNTFAPRIPVDGVTVLSGNDGPIDAALTAAGYFTIVNVEEIDVTTVPLGTQTPHPGDTDRTLLHLRLVNSTSQPVTLDAVTLDNTSTGAGTTADLDANMSTLRVYTDDGNGLIDPWDAVVADDLQFSNGTLTTNALGVSLDVGTPYHLLVTCDVNTTCAADLDTLAVSVTDASSLQFDSPLVVSGVFPLATEAQRVIDGMMSAQIPVYPVADSSIATTPTDNLVFEFALSANGYRPDTLTALGVTNLGTATPDHISRLALFSDGGDGTFDAGAGDDILLGDFTPLGLSEHLLAGLDVPLGACGAGTRFYVSADLAADPPSGASMQFMISTMGVTVASDNDGPIDGPVVNPTVQFVPKPDELTAFPYSTGNARPLPGATDQLNFGVGFYNGFDTPVTLSSIDLFQQGSAISSEIMSAHAYADTDTNGLFNPGSDALLASVPSTSTYFSLEQLGLALTPKKITYLFVTYDLGMGVRDSVTVNLQLNGPIDLEFESDDVTVEGEFPINSPGVDVTDGMIAAQIDVAAAPEYRASPGEAHVNTVGFTVPANGFLSDALRFVSVRNNGDAAAGQDIAAVNLWVEDSGDQQFDAMNDRLASSLVWTGSAWRNAVALTEPITIAGLRCYVSVDIAPTATDNRTIRLSLPVDGIEVASGNDGPNDYAVENPIAQIISTDPLLTGLWLDRATYSTGQSVTLTMEARNAGLTTLTGVHPSQPGLSGPGSLLAMSGPTPGIVDLAPGADTTFTWVFTAETAGSFDFCGQAFSADSSEVSEETCTGTHVIQRKPYDFSLAIDDVAPTGANRGQQNVALAKLILSYNGFDSLSTDVTLTAFPLSVLSQGGGHIPPNTRLAGIKLSSSTGNSYAVTTVDSSTSPMWLQLDPPITVEPQAIVELDITAEISTSATLAPFAIGIDAVDRVMLNDANDGVTVVASSGETYPWATNPIAVSLPAETLLVATSDTSTITVNVGQTDVTVFDGTMLNSGPGQSADMRLTGLAFDFYDEDGTPIDASDVAQSVSLYVDGAMQLERYDFPVGDNRVQCDIVNTILLNAGSSKRVELRVDTRPFPAQNGFYVTIYSEAGIVARDANSGDVVIVSPVTPGSFPLYSRTLLFQAPATRLEVSGRTDSPETVLPSATDVRIMTVALRHADALDASAMTIDSLAIDFVDPLGSPLKPGDWLSALRLVHGTQTIATITPLSITESLVECRMSPPIVLSPGQSDSIAVYVDARGLVAPTRFFARIERSQIHALDMNDGSRVLGIEGDFPLIAGPYWLRIPGANIFAALDSRLPANVSGKEQNVAAFDLTLENRNQPGYTGATFSDLVVSVTHDDGAPIEATELFSDVSLQLGDTASVTGTLVDSDVHFAFSPPIVMGAGESVMMTMTANLDVATTNCGFRFVVRDAMAISLRDASTDEVVMAGSDKGYPLMSSAAHVLAASESGGFTNYPNPFGAGRELTRVTFFLDEPSRVTIKLYTLWGKPVKTLLSGSHRSAGLHQDIAWNGQTGDGDVVNNGVYYLVLDIVGDSGKATSLRRKVGVVR